MKILPFIQSLANELKCQYSLGEILTMNNHNQYFIPDGIIYREEKPFLIIEDKHFKDSEQYNDAFARKLSRIQDYLGIKWAVLLDEGRIYLRKESGYFEHCSDFLEAVQKIKTDKENIVPPLSKDFYLETIKRILVKHQDRLRRVRNLSQFISELRIEDIEIDDNGIYLSDTKETDFFMSILTPVEKENLWRYTTKNSLFLTLREHCQNMLSLNCMNDISEIDYADKYIDTETCLLRKSIDEANKVFILSCCDETKSDDLMMWRLYAQDAEGVSLCYHLYSNLIDNEYFFLANVCYGLPNSHPELDLIKDLMAWPVNGPRFKFRKWIVWKHFFKSYHFGYEEEVRMIYYEHEKSLATKTMWIEDNKSGIATPMKLFCLEYNYIPRFPLALIKILIGPKSKEAPVNLVQFNKMYNEAKIFCPGIRQDFSLSKIDIYR